jgi:hypothetical protein
MGWPDVRPPHDRSIREEEWMRAIAPVGVFSPYLMSDRGSVIQGYFPAGLTHLTHLAAQAAHVRPMPSWAQQSVQRKTAGPHAVAAAALRVPADAHGGMAMPLPRHIARPTSHGGQPLPADVRQRMESLFGQSFSNVRVHVGRDAAAIGALAFTHGTDIYFAPGQFDPASPQGRKVLGHELTHVVQQRTGRARNPFGSGIAVVHDRALEAEADRMAERAFRYAPVQRKAVAPRVVPLPGRGGRGTLQRFVNPLLTDDLIGDAVNPARQRLRQLIEQYNDREDQARPDFYDTVTFPPNWLRDQLASLTALEAELGLAITADAATGGANRAALLALKQDVTRDKQELGTDETSATLKILLAANPRIVVTVGCNMSRASLLATIRKYLAGTLVLYRGIQQWHHFFPTRADCSDIRPKRPGSNSPPDFADNENSWLPFTAEYETAVGVAAAVGSIFRTYWREGRLNEKKPMGVVLQVRVDPQCPIAFGFDGEIQLMGPLVADRVKKFMVDDDLGLAFASLQGKTFRELLGPKS